MIYNFDDLSFQILTVDFFSHKDGFFDVKPRPYAAFSFKISGTGYFEIGEKQFVTNAGDVLFIPADTPYKVDYSGSKSIVVHLKLCNYHEAENICIENKTAIDLRFQNLLMSWTENHSANLAKSIMYGILEKIANDKKSAIDNTVLANCVRYIEEHFCDPELNIETVCNVGFISVSSLQRAFSEYLGISPKQYIIKLRMNKALELLSENKASVKEIAFACGFTDDKYFSRTCKKIYGYPPSQLRSHVVF